MNVSQLKQSNFLTRGDVGAGVLVTIREVFQENVAKQGAPEEQRWCIAFDEFEKPMVLNSTNGQIIATITKSPDSDVGWIGTKIVIYDDPNVSFGGKLVGGIRVRAPRGQAAKPAAAPAKTPSKLFKLFQAPAKPAPVAEAEPQAEAPEDDSSDVPF